MELLTRKTGIWIAIIGILIFLFNFVTMTLWEIDIDILGATIFLLGLLIAIACGKSMKHSKRLFSRRNGVLLCIIVVIITMVFAYSPIPYLNGDFGGMIGSIFFLLGIILIAVRWKY